VHLHTPASQQRRSTQRTRLSPNREAPQTAISAGTRWLTGCHHRVMADASRLRVILELVEESLDEPDIDGAELASRAYLSRYHFDPLVHAAPCEPPRAL